MVAPGLVVAGLVAGYCAVVDSVVGTLSEGVGEGAALSWAEIGLVVACLEEDNPVVGPQVWEAGLSGAVCEERDWVVEGWAVEGWEGVEGRGGSFAAPPVSTRHPRSWTLDIQPASNQLRVSARRLQIAPPLLPLLCRSLRFPQRFPPPGSTLIFSRWTLCWL